MKGNKVEIILNTPILIELGDGDSAHKNREEAVARILGTILENGEGGFTVEISELFNEKKHKVAFHRRWVFLPYYKVDHLFSVT